MLIFIGYSSPVFAGDAVLSWNPGPEPDLAGYHIHYGTASGVYTQMIMVGLTNTPSAPQYAVTNLNSGTTYYFAVTSYDTFSNQSGLSNEVSKTFPPDMVPPPPPPKDVSNFIAVPGEGQVGLSWNNPDDPNFSGVRIRFRTDGTYPTDQNDGDLVGDFPGPPALSQGYVHAHLQDGTTYYYSAFSYDAHGNFSHTVHASATPASPATVPPPPPAPPPAPEQAADQSHPSQHITGGCGMVSPGDGKPSGPGQAADMVGLFAAILIVLMRKRFRTVVGCRGSVGCGDSSDSEMSFSNSR